MNDYKQIIIVRKDLNMSKGKMAAQVAHAASAFLCNFIMQNINPENYFINKIFSPAIYEYWIKKDYTKVILQAKNKNQLLKAKTLAKEFNLQEGKDFFIIHDKCYTELEPEEEDKTTITCIGFKPLPSAVIDQIGKKYHIYTE